MKQYLIAFMLLLCTASLKANDLQIANITTNVNGGVTTVSFDISWKNSWRGGIANNYDAAWVFIKYKDDNGEWHHLNLTGTNNSVGAPLMIEAPGDKKGVFVYRAADGMGDLAPVNVTLGVQQQAGNYDIKVIGIEMVFIPQGSFYLGGFWGTGLFKGTTTDYQPYLINSSIPPTKGNAALSELNDTRGNGILNPQYPTGYNSFYCMKYEISQGGYRDFLNSCSKFANIYLERTSLTNMQYNTAGFPALMGDYRNILESTGIQNAAVGTDANGNNVYNEPNDGEWTACNYLYWSDIAAYLDWAALRPMTEFEWGKLFRGPTMPTGVSSVNSSSVEANVYPIANPFTQNETVQVDAGTSGINTGFLGGLSILGPLRNGFAATTSSNRVTSGASYYGVMEVCGNVDEYCVTSANNAGRSFTGILGDGELDQAGKANAQFWPGNNNLDVNSPNGTGSIPKLSSAGAVSLGGSFSANFLPTAAGIYLNPLDATQGSRATLLQSGGRGVRQQF